MKFISKVSWIYLDFDVIKEFSVYGRGAWFLFYPIQWQIQEILRGKDGGGAH
jgi:hypothetical protein